VTRAGAGPGARRPGRPRSAEADRAILGAALQIAAESGLARMTMEAVAARAGVGKATVYRRWDSKEALFADALRSVAGDLPVPEDTGSFRGDWLALFGGERAVIAPAAIRIMPRLMAEAGDDPLLFRVVYDTMVGPRRAVGAELVRRGQARGELREDLDPDVVVDLVVGPLVYRALIAGELDSLTGHLAAALDVLLAGISAPRRAGGGHRRRAG
jgi:AcrR family transcriptional regulator